MIRHQCEQNRAAKRYDDSPFSSHAVVPVTPVVRLLRAKPSWQTTCVERLETRGLTRDKALREMLRLYMEGQSANEPVHTWELPAA